MRLLTVSLLCLATVLGADAAVEVEVWRGKCFELPVPWQLEAHVTSVGGESVAQQKLDHEGTISGQSQCNLTDGCSEAGHKSVSLWAAVAESNEPSEPEDAQSDPQREFELRFDVIPRADVQAVECRVRPDDGFAEPAETLVFEFGPSLAGEVLSLPVPVQIDEESVFGSMRVTVAAVMADGGKFQKRYSISCGELDRVRVDPAEQAEALREMRKQQQETGRVPTKTLPARAVIREIADDAL